MIDVSSDRSVARALCDRVARAKAFLAQSLQLPAWDPTGIGHSSHIFRDKLIVTFKKGSLCNLLYLSCNMLYFFWLSPIFLNSILLIVSWDQPASFPGARDQQGTTHHTTQKPDKTDGSRGDVPGRNIGRLKNWKIGQGNKQLRKRTSRICG